MSLAESLNKEFVAAYKAKDEERVGVLRMLKTAVKNLSVDLKREPDDGEVLTIIAKQLKQRQEASEQFRAAGRDDLADKEDREAVILRDYLPEQLEGDKLEAAIDEAVTEAGASSMRDMGAVMKILNAKYKGRMDGKAASEMVRARLS